MQRMIAAAMVILMTLTMTGCSLFGFAKPEESDNTQKETGIAQTETGEADKTAEPTEDTEATEESTEATEATEPTEETEPEEEDQGSGGSGGNDTPGGQNPDFGSDDDDDADKEEEEPFAAPAPGTEQNPYLEVVGEIPAQVNTVMLPAQGTVYYQIQSNGKVHLMLEKTDVTITCGETVLEPDEEGTIELPVDGTAEQPVIQITNPSEEEKICTIQFLPEKGTRDNPEIVADIAQIPVKLAQGDEDGYHYLWNVTDTCELTLAPQVPGYEVRAICADTVLSSADRANGTLVLDVWQDTQLLIQVIAVPDEEGIYPAVEDTLLGIVPEKGSLKNPVVLSSLEEVMLSLNAETITSCYYSWTAEKDGTLSLHVDAVTPEELTAGITLVDKNAVISEEPEQPEETDDPQEAVDAEEPAEAEQTEEMHQAEEAETSVLTAMSAAEKKAVRMLPTALAEEALEHTEEPEDPALTEETEAAEEPEETVAEIEEPAQEQVQEEEPVEEEAQESPEENLRQPSMTPEEAAKIAASLQPWVTREMKAGETVVFRVEAAPDATGTYQPVVITFSGSFEVAPGQSGNPIALKTPEDTAAVPAGATRYFTADAPGTEMILAGESVSVILDEEELLPVNGEIRITLGEEAVEFAIRNDGETDAVYKIMFVPLTDSEELVEEEEPAADEESEENTEPVIEESPEEVTEPVEGEESEDSTEPTEGDAPEEDMEPEKEEMPAEAAEPEENPEPEQQAQESADPDAGQPEVTEKALPESEN